MAPASWNVVLILVRSCGGGRNQKGHLSSYWNDQETQKKKRKKKNQMAVGGK